jgi:hypothetical protein
LIILDSSKSNTVIIDEKTNFHNNFINLRSYSFLDEDISKLGEKLMLPDRYESRRQEIEKRLPDLDAAVAQVELSRAV